MKRLLGPPLVIALCLTALQCVEPPGDVVMPTWDVTLTVPVMNATYALGSIIVLDSTMVDSLGTSSKVSVSNLAGILQDTTVIGDSTGDGQTDQWVDETTAEKLTAATAFVEVENGIPGTLRVKLAMLDAVGTVLFWVPAAQGDSLVIDAPDIVDGDVVAPRVTRTPLELSVDGLRQLSRVSRVAYTIAAETPAGQSVNVMLSDQVVMRSWAQLTYRVAQ
jgi:hypothetical protein